VYATHRAMVNSRGIVPAAVVVLVGIAYSGKGLNRSDRSRNVKVSERKGQMTFSGFQIYVSVVCFSSRWQTCEQHEVADLCHVSPLPSRAMSAASRAEARRQAILSRGSDRLAKLTTSARGENAPAYMHDGA
jgi:hypothetical protein